MNCIVAVVSAAIWTYLLAARGQFWRCLVRDDAPPIWPGPWPSIAAIIPARNEADYISLSVQSLLRQDYCGSLRVIVVDDNSDDCTPTAACAAASDVDGDITLIASTGPPAMWTGKLWALKQGIDAAQTMQPEFILLTDADIVHAPDTLACLAAKALTGSFVLTSLMAKLRCESLAERMHMPALIYFFQMLYPFSWICCPNRKIAAAAGGCMLIRADAIVRVGGVAAIHNALIDDCALAAKLKMIGPIWLGLTDRVRSVRAHPTFAAISDMVARSAYAQLRYSPLLLSGTIAGITLTFVAPPLLAIFALGWPKYLGLATLLASAVSFAPTLRFYNLSLLWTAGLPVIASLYSFYTIVSAYQHLRGRGGQWKGRVYSNAPILQ